MGLKTTLAGVERGLPSLMHAPRDRHELGGTRSANRRQKEMTSLNIFRKTVPFLITPIGVGALLLIACSGPPIKETRAQPSSIQSSTGDQETTKYLAFQVFIGESDPSVFLGTSQADWTLENARSGKVGGAP